MKVEPSQGMSATESMKESPSASKLFDCVQIQLDGMEEAPVLLDVAAALSRGGAHLDAAALCFKAALDAVVEGYQPVAALHEGARRRRGPLRQG